MTSSYLTLLILAALPVRSDQHAAAGAGLQENPVLQASEETDPAFSLFDNKGFDDEKKDDDLDDEKEDEMVGATRHFLKSFCPLSLEL